MLDATTHRGRVKWVRMARARGIGARLLEEEGPHNVEGRFDQTVLATALPS